MIEGQEDVGWPQWLALARAAERAGLDGIFSSDHAVSVYDEPERGAFDVWSVLAGLAAVTERLRLGTLVSPVGFRRPAQLARTATTVDHISGGRIEVGTGAGWFEREHVAFGFPFPDGPSRLRAFSEQLEALARLWTEDAVSLAGETLTLDAAQARPRPVQQPHPPLIVGGGGKRGTVEPAVRWAQEYNTAFASPDDFRALCSRLDEACARAGRDPATLRRSLMTGCIVGADEREVRERLRATIARTGRAVEPEAFLQEHPNWLAGTVEQVVERLRALADAGVERAMLRQLDHADVEAVALLGEVQAALAAG